MLSVLSICVLRVFEISIMQCSQCADISCCAHRQICLLTDLHVYNICLGVGTILMHTSKIQLDVLKVPTLR